MKILPTQALREIDRYTIEQEGVKPLELISRVADAAASEIMHRFPVSTPVTVFAGKGNNGADALMTALVLHEAGFKPEVHLFNIGGDSLSADCRECRDILLNSGFKGLNEVITEFTLPELTERHVVVDGLYGTGLKEPLTGGFMTVAREINASEAWVLSIDIPSGMFGDWNSNRGVISRNVVHASLTLGVQFPKLAYFIADTGNIIGEWKLVDIGLSRKAENSTQTKTFSIGREEVRAILKPRNPFTSKNDYGWALLVAGCYGMMGAAVMSGRGALRAGVGKLTVHSASCGFEILQTSVPEAMFSPDEGKILISEIPTRAHYSAVGLGPGLGTNDATRGAVESFIKASRQPLVLDADALNIISLSPGLLEHVPKGSILTPHEGEFDRLFGAHNCTEARLRRALEITRRLGIVIVLKGRYTATVCPGGEMFFNTSGSAAMATPGSGDVLTGVITALVAQGYPTQAAATAGVYVHGLAGDLAAKEQGQYGVTAGDIAQNIGRAINSIMTKG